MKYTIEKGKVINKLLGYTGLKSFATLYPNGGSKNAFGFAYCSTHTIKHCLTSDEKIRFIETHITYFKVKPNTSKVNEFLEKNGPQTIDSVISFLTGLGD